MKPFLFGCLALAGPWLLGDAGLRADDGDKPASAKAAATEAPATKTAHGLRLEAAARQRLGLATQSVLETNLPSSVVAFGVVLDPSPLALLDTELDGAAAALAIARVQEERERALFNQAQIVARPALEAAQLLVRADETRFDMAQRRLATEWGDPFVQLEATKRHLLIGQLLRREVILLRVELPAGEAGVNPESPVKLVPLNERRDRTAQWFCEAPTVDARTQGRAFLLRATGPDPALRPGAAVTAQLAGRGDPRPGWLVPSEAVVRHLGQAWVYLAPAEDAFEPVVVLLDQWTDHGWFTTTPLPAGSKVVSAGAQLLLSEQLKSQLVGE